MQKLSVDGRELVVRLEELDGGRFAWSLLDGDRVLDFGNASGVDEAMDAALLAFELYLALAVV